MTLLAWMSWTTPVAIFFIGIAVLLVGMTVLEIRSPTVARRGFLPLVTTRGDRLFISLLAAAYINLAWTGLTELTQWGAVAIAAVVAGIILKWG
jgi:predicted small integral membrane protein